jgi:hypothetical protein
LPLRQVDGLEAALQWLFSETDRVLCGQRIMANRLFGSTNAQAGGIDVGLIFCPKTGSHLW